MCQAKRGRGEGGRDAVEGIIKKKKNINGGIFREKNSVPIFFSFLLPLSFFFILAGVVFFLNLLPLTDELKKTKVV